MLVAAGMGLYPAAATLSQAALARAQARAAPLCWTVAAAAFVAILLAWRLEGRVLQVEIGFVGAAAALCVLLGLLYRRGEGKAESRGMLSQERRFPRVVRPRGCPHRPERQRPRGYSLPR